MTSRALRRQAGALLRLADTLRKAVNEGGAITGQVDRQYRRELRAADAAIASARRQLSR